MKIQSYQGSNLQPSNRTRTALPGGEKIYEWLTKGHATQAKQQLLLYTENSVFSFQMLSENIQISNICSSFLK